jgi:hypothetical protein
MATTTRGSQGQCSTPRLTDPLHKMQCVRASKWTATSELNSRLTPGHAPKHAPETEATLTSPAEWIAEGQQVLSELALLLAIQRIAETHGNSLRQQASIWSPYR